MTEYLFNRGYNTSGSCGWTDIYTTPTTRRSILTSFVAANSSGSSGNSVYISSRLWDTSGSAGYNLINEAEVPIGTSLEMISGKIVLEEDDKIQIAQSSSGSASFILSGLEVTT